MATIAHRARRHARHLALALLAVACGPAAMAAWTPQASDTFHLQLQGAIDTSIDVVAYDIDLVDTPDSVLQALHAQGRQVICYFSAGTAEDWRPDYDQFKAADKGNADAAEALKQLGG